MEGSFHSFTGSLRSFRNGPLLLRNPKFLTPFVGTWPSKCKLHCRKQGNSARTQSLEVYRPRQLRSFHWSYQGCQCWQASCQLGISDFKVLLPRATGIHAQSKKNAATPDGLGSSPFWARFIDLAPESSRWALPWQFPSFQECFPSTLCTRGQVFSRSRVKVTPHLLRPDMISPVTLGSNLSCNCLFRDVRKPDFWSC